MRKQMTLIATVLVALVGVAATGHAQSAPQFVLSGVVFVEGGTGGRAWLQEPTLTQNQVTTMRPGDTLGPYRLAAIFEDRVEMIGPNGKFSVPLAGVSGPATAAAPAARPAAASPIGSPTGGPTQEPTGPAPVVESRKDPSKLFDFKDFGALLGGRRN